VPEFRAPGRVNLIGDHTDYNDGFVLPLAIDLECVVRSRPRDDDMGVVKWLDGDHDSDRFAHGVVTALAERGRRPVGIDAEVRSTIPVGSGLSSSAALEVGLALALCDAAGLRLDPIDLAQACQEAEHIASGVPCGIMDQLASVAGREGCALLIDLPVARDRADPDPGRSRRGRGALRLATGARRECLRRPTASLRGSGGAARDPGPP